MGKTLENFIQGTGSVLSIAPKPSSRFSYRRPTINSAEQAWGVVARSLWIAFSQAEKKQGGIHGSTQTSIGHAWYCSAGAGDRPDARDRQKSRMPSSA